MSAAEQTKEVIELAAGYTKQIVDALTPIAKQGYEIGLLTLQIDAARDLLIGLLFIPVAYFSCKMAIKHYRKSGEVLSFDEAFSFFSWGVAAPLTVVTFAVYFMDVWTWVKLFNPELWLAHEAVSKILN